MDEFIIFGRARLRAFNDYKDQIGVGERFHGFADADGLGFVKRTANARRVYEFYRDTAQTNGLADQIPRGARRGSDNRALTLDQTVKQARLPYVGATHNGQGEAFVHDFAVSEAGGQLLERSAERSDVLEDCGSGHDGNVVLREVDARLQQRNQLNQLLLNRLQALGKSSVKLLRRNFRLIQSLRVDKVADRFGLREVNASPEKGSHGELARFG